MSARSAITIVSSLASHDLVMPGFSAGRVFSFLQLSGPVQHDLQRCRPFLVRGLHHQETPAISLIIASSMRVASTEKHVCRAGTKMRVRFHHDRHHRIARAMKAVAIRKGQMRERVPGFTEMGTLRCDHCGEEFIIVHDPAFLDSTLAEQQAHWLEKVLAEEHERERKHPDRIQLPG